MVKQITER